MDIAKIRKKFQESEQERKETAQNGQAVEEQKPNDKPRKKRVSKSPKSEEAPAVAETEIGIQAEPKSDQAELSLHEKQAPKEEIPASSEAEQQEEEIVEILTFRLLKEEFAFEISHLNEILRLQRITPVPKMPQYVQGITSLRGKIIPVIDLKKKLSLTENSEHQDAKSKILIIKGTRGPVGVIVDRVIAVLRIARDDILPPPSHLSDIELKFIDGVAVIDKHFISIINMKEAISIVFEN